jgi:transposase
MIPVPTGIRIWIATGHTDMRRGMRGLALQVQEGLGRDPFAGDVFVFRGRSGSLIKAIWHDGLGLSLYGVKTRKCLNCTTRENKLKTHAARIDSCRRSGLSPPLNG